MKIRNPYPKPVDSIFTQYQHTEDFDTECIEERDVLPYSTSAAAAPADAEDYEVIYTAYCFKTAPVAVVDIWFSSSDLDGNAIIPQCCHPDPGNPNNALHYMFKVMCEPEPKEARKQV